MSDFHDHGTLGARTLGHVPSRTPGVDAPGKRTLTQADAAPIQRKDDPKSHPVPDSAFVAQYADYGKDTDLGRADDCGPSVILMAIRAMGAEPNLIAAMPEKYKPVNALREIKFICQTAWGTEDSAARTPVELQNGMVAVLDAIGVKIDDKRKTFEFLNSGSKATYTDSKDALEDDGPAGTFIQQHCVDGSAVIAMGYAKGGPWGWGPEQDPNHRAGSDGQPQTITDRGDHFVLVWRPDQTKDEYTVMDPSWSAPLKGKPLTDIIGFIAARSKRLGGSTTMNIMAVPYAQIAEMIPRLAAADAHDGTAGGGTGGGAKAGAKAGGASGASIKWRPSPTQAKRGAAPAGPVEDGPGASLPSPTRFKMEDLFGVDMSAVRVHQGGAAPAVGALAYTQANEVHFAPGQYQPGTPDGDRLIGHELAHVVQQRDGRVASPQHKGAVVEDAGLEAEADAFGDRAARGETTAAPLRSAPAPTDGAVQRDTDVLAIVARLHEIERSARARADALLPKDPLTTQTSAADPSTLRTELQKDTKEVADLSTGAQDARIKTAATAANDAIVAVYQAMAVVYADATAQQWASSSEADQRLMAGAFRDGSAGKGDDDYCGEFVKAQFVSAGLPDFFNPTEGGSHFRSSFNHTDNVRDFFQYNEDFLRIPGYILPHNDPKEGWTTVHEYHTRRNSLRTHVETPEVMAAQAAGTLGNVMRPGDVATMYYGTNANSDPDHADHTLMVRRVIDGSTFESIEGNAIVTDAKGTSADSYEVGTNQWGPGTSKKDPQRTFHSDARRQFARVFLVGRFSAVDFEAGHGYSLHKPAPDAKLEQEPRKQGTKKGAK